MEPDQYEQQGYKRISSYFKECTRPIYIKDYDTSTPILMNNKG